ncbi:MAG: LPS export ABC transporter periplasmic protein LptC [Cytophaga sp.]|nr:LPS export ABC transporter periplasmic protein LptC [Cytophaga sp.]
MALALFSCETEKKKQIAVYNGSLREFENVDMTYSEKDAVKVKMQAKKIIELQNGDREFPDGLYMEFFDVVTGEKTSTLKANNAYYFKEEDQWRGRGKVEVKNIQKHQELTTEELFWKPATKKIFTDKFVTIREIDRVIYGTGLETDQNLTNYTITKPEGEFDVEEN